MRPIRFANVGGPAPLLLAMFAGAACAGDDGGFFAEDASTSSDAPIEVTGTGGNDGDEAAGTGGGGSGGTGGTGGGGAGGRGGTVRDATSDDGPRTVADAESGAATEGGGTVAPDAGPTTPDSGGSLPESSADRGIGNCVGTVSVDFLREKLSQLSGALPVLIGMTDTTIPERNSAANRQRARQFLTAEYEALGFTVVEHAYATGVNLVASKPGADAKFLIVSAHYDSRGDTVPGADDDGTGVIAGLATAKALQNCQLDHGLRIVAFDEEEDGLVGARAYVSHLQPTSEWANLIGDVQLEMLGYHTKQDGGFLLVDCRSSEGDRPESQFLNDAVISAIARGNLALEPKDACTGSSDHSAFWTAGKPAIVYSQEFFFSGADSTPCYHRDCDKVDQINFDYFAKLTTLTVVLTAELVGAR